MPESRPRWFHDAQFILLAGLTPSQILRNEVGHGMASMDRYWTTGSRAAVCMDVISAICAYRWRGAPQTLRQTPVHARCVPLEGMYKGFRETYACSLVLLCSCAEAFSLRA
eukprot:scaffold100905_cov32-Prasinocladus_malaysianus.AAC.1